MDEAADQQPSQPPGRDYHTTKEEKHDAHFYCSGSVKYGRHISESCDSFSGNGRERNHLAGDALEYLASV